MVWLVQIHVCNSSNPQSLRGWGVRPLDPLLGLCPGPAGDRKRSPDPSPTHAPPPLIPNPGSAPAYGVVTGIRYTVKIDKSDMHTI